MNTGEPIIMAHEGELDGACLCGGRQVRAYEDVTSPFEAERLVLLPLCAERIPTEQVIPPLRLVAHATKLTVLGVPVLDEKLAGQCDGRC